MRSFIVKNAAVNDVFGVHWDVGTPVVAMEWSPMSRALAFALGDGTLALAETSLAQRSNRGALSNRGPDVGLFKREAAPLLRIPVHDGMCLTLSADASGGFISGGDDGRLARTSAEGKTEILVDRPGRWIDHVARSAADGVVFASGRELTWLEDVEKPIRLPSLATALALDPTGKEVAVSHHDGVSVLSRSGKFRRLHWPGYHRTAAWSPDGSYLFTGMQENALHGWRLADGGDIEIGGYPSQPLSLSFVSDGRLLATSGGNRVICWRVGATGGSSAPIQCGAPSKTPVTKVCAHPRKNLIAAGYHNGAIVLTAPGREDYLILKYPGDGAISALTWTTDGQILAFSTERGQIGWMSLVELLSRFEAGWLAAGSDYQVEAMS
jgi:WD40 repeat protein